MVNSITDACCALKNAERARKNEVIISPASKSLQQILRIYDDGRQGKFKIALMGRINECAGLLRLNYKISQFESLERRLLPAPGLGIIVFTTNQGIMTMKEAEEQRIGGHALCYIY
ncbi:MAG: 30S ribosomal protein S8 [Promethearchaeota archaeon]|jgi:small subunit ribosomal protein S8